MVNERSMPAWSDDARQLGHELLRIKGALHENRHSEQDVEVYRVCLSAEGDLALIAAGYALSENLTDVKQAAVAILQQALGKIRVGGVLPGRWAELAILEGLLFADVATLLPVKEDIIAYLRRLLAEPPKMADVANASSLLRRLASLDVEGVTDLIKKIDEMA